MMCATASSIIGIKEVYYDCANDKCGGCSSIRLLHQVAPRNELVMEFWIEGFPMSWRYNGIRSNFSSARFL
ncbi:hypothetical protein EUGRSUZ_E02155 [Eucalyptus grandis]|uniref:Uncharacterized protein n=2 Tax=Eucalyptus grandis TaxID=71139 RepID=A0ACC3KXH7_EUCGR|nr:hypothetical protein EUGRSUZ_E02155 [Eucalyptus grandis]